MKQQKIDGDKTLTETHLDRNPTVWVCGMIFDKKKGEFYYHNGSPWDAKK